MGACKAKNYLNKIKMRLSTIWFFASVFVFFLTITKTVAALAGRTQ
jgi:hypothetical protein